MYSLAAYARGRKNVIDAVGRLLEENPSKELKQNLVKFVHTWAMAHQKTPPPEGEKAQRFAEETDAIKEEILGFGDRFALEEGQKQSLEEAARLFILPPEQPALAPGGEDAAGVINGATTAGRDSKEYQKAVKTIATDLYRDSAAYFIAIGPSALVVSTKQSLELLATHEDKLSSYIVSSILGMPSTTLPGTEQVREKFLFWLDVLTKSFNEGDLATARTIVTSLNAAPIGRLVQKLLKEKDHDSLNIFSNLLRSPPSIFSEALSRFSKGTLTLPSPVCYGGMIEFAQNDPITGIKAIGEKIQLLKECQDKAVSQRLPLMTTISTSIEKAPKYADFEKTAYDRSTSILPREGYTPASTPSVTAPASLPQRKTVSSTPPPLQAPSPEVAAVSPKSQAPLPKKSDTVSQIRENIERVETESERALALLEAYRTLFEPSSEISGEDKKELTEQFETASIVLETTEKERESAAKLARKDKLSPEEKGLAKTLFTKAMVSLVCLNDPSVSKSELKAYIDRCLPEETKKQLLGKDLYTFYEEETKEIPVAPAKGPLGRLSGLMNEVSKNKKKLLFNKYGDLQLIDRKDTVFGLPGRSSESRAAVRELLDEIEAAIQQSENLNNLLLFKNDLSNFLGSVWLRCAAFGNKDYEQKLMAIVNSLQGKIKGLKKDASSGLPVDKVPAEVLGTGSLPSTQPSAEKPESEKDILKELENISKEKYFEAPPRRSDESEERRTTRERAGTYSEQGAGPGSLSEMEALLKEVEGKRLEDEKRNEIRKKVLIEIEKRLKESEQVSKELEEALRKMSEQKAERGLKEIEKSLERGNEKLAELEKIDQKAKEATIEDLLAGDEDENNQPEKDPSTDAPEPPHTEDSPNAGGKP